jgi:hypothetical protein
MRMLSSRHGSAATTSTTLDGEVPLHAAFVAHHRIQEPDMTITSEPRELEARATAGTHRKGF